MPITNFAAWMKKEGLTIERLSTISGLNKKTIQRLRTNTPEENLKVHIETFIKLKEAFPRENFKKIFSCLSEL